MDVSSAFLHADIDTECYLKAPEGFKNRNKYGEDLVWKLKKAVYGLKQSPNLWYNLVKTRLAERGLEAIENEHCIHTITEKDDKVIILHHVDDFLLIGPKGNLFDKARHILKTAFKTKDLGYATRFLNIKIERDRNERSISLSQSHYIREKLLEYQLENIKTASIPLSNEPVPEYNQDDNFHTERYLEFIGAINYLAVKTRPDLLHAVSVLSKFLANHNEVHFKKVINLWRYISATKETKLVLKDRGDSDKNWLSAYTDSNWAGDAKTSRSRSGHAIIFRGSCISWYSKQQTTIALSSAEAELNALATATQRLEGIKNVLTAVLDLPPSPSLIWEDNVACMKIAKGQGDIRKIRHVSIKQHFVRDRILVGAIELDYVPTNKNIADVFTKPVSARKLREHFGNIGLTMK